MIFFTEIILAIGVRWETNSRSSRRAFGTLDLT